MQIENGCEECGSENLMLSVFGNFMSCSETLVIHSRDRSCVYSSILVSFDMYARRFVAHYCAS